MLVSLSQGPGTSGMPRAPRRALARLPCVQFDEPQSVKFAEGNGRKGSLGSLDLTRLDLNLNHLYNEHRVLIERHARKLGHRPLWASMHAYTAVL